MAISSLRIEPSNVRLLQLSVNDVACWTGVIKKYKGEENAQSLLMVESSEHFWVLSLFKLWGISPDDFLSSDIEHLESTLFWWTYITFTKI